jgi:hypothetical protein
MLLNARQGRRRLRKALTLISPWSLSPANPPDRLIPSPLLCSVAQQGHVPNRTPASRHRAHSRD